MILRRPPQAAHALRSAANTRASRAAQPRRWAQGSTRGLPSSESFQNVLVQSSLRFQKTNVTSRKGLREQGIQLMFFHDDTHSFGIAAKAPQPERAADVLTPISGNVLTICDPA